MPRSTQSSTRRKRKKGLIKEAKGYKWQRSRKYRAAKQARLKALTYAYRDRKTRKRFFRRLWQIRINAAVRKMGLTYSHFIHLLKKGGVNLNRKVLSELAVQNPKVFEEIVNEVKEK